MSGKIDQDKIVELIDELREWSSPDRDGCGRTWDGSHLLDDRVVEIIQELVAETEPIDTSVPASIRRLNAYMDQDSDDAIADLREGYYSNELWEADIRRVIEAAEYHEVNKCIPKQKPFMPNKSEIIAEVKDILYQPERFGEGWVECHRCDATGEVLSDLSGPNKVCHQCDGRGRYRKVVTKKPEKIHYEEDIWAHRDKTWKIETAGDVNNYWTFYDAWAPKIPGETSIPEFCDLWERNQ